MLAYRRRAAPLSSRCASIGPSPGRSTATGKAAAGKGELSFVKCPLCGTKQSIDARRRACPALGAKRTSLILLDVAVTLTDIDAGITTDPSKVAASGSLGWMLLLRKSVDVMSL